MNLSEALRNLALLEGRYTVDDGGPTESGITQEAYDQYCTDMGLPSTPVQDLTQIQISNFYQVNYWDPLMCDKLQNGVDFVLFQWALNHEGAGDRGGSVKTIQICSGVVPDGIMGSETVTAANHINSMKLMACMLSRQEAWYRNEHKKDPSMPLDGWLNRIKKVKRIVGLPENV